jgi:hypothetical protein
MEVSLNFSKTQLLHSKSENNNSSLIDFVFKDSKEIMQQHRCMTYDPVSPQGMKMTFSSRVVICSFLLFSHSNYKGSLLLAPVPNAGISCTEFGWF